MKNIIILLSIIAIAQMHIYSSTPKVTYDFNGRPKFYSLYMSLQTGLGANDYLRLIWPEQIHNTVKTQIVVNLITYNNNIKIGTSTCVAEAVLGASTYHVTLGTQMQANTWYELQVFPTKNPVTSPINYLLQVMTVSTYNVNQIIYDSNLAFGFLNILAPLATPNTLTMSINSASAQKNIPSAIYEVDIDIIPTISSSTGGNFTLSIFYDIGVAAHATGTTILDFSFLGICGSAAYSISQTAVILNYCAISSDFSTITFSVNTITATKPIRIRTSVSNPVYHSIRGLRGYWSQFISGKVIENKAIDSAFIVNKISILSSTERILLFWGIQSTYTDSNWVSPVPLFKAAIANPSILPYNSFNCGFSFSSTASTDGNYTVKMTIGATGVLQGSIVHNLPAYSGMTIFCYYVSPQIICKNVGAFINTNYRYWISGKAYFASTTASTVVFGGVSIQSIVYSSTGAKILTPVLYDALTGVTLNVQATQQFLDNTGYHDPTIFSIGNAQVVSFLDDATLSSTANAVPGYLQGTNSTAGIVPDLGTAQQLLFLMKTTTASISGATAATNYQIQLMFNSKVIGFESTDTNRGLDFVGYNSVTNTWSIQQSPCYLTTIICQKYNQNTPNHNKRVVVNTGDTKNYYGMYKFKCGTSVIASPSPACTSNCANQCTMFSGYGSTTGSRSVMAMRQVIIDSGYHPSIYADNNLLDFLFIFTHGTQIISYCLINAYTITGAKLTNIKASFVNYYDNTAGSYNKGVRIPMMLRLAGGILPSESLSATAIGIFIDDNIDSSTFYTSPDESWNLGCSTNDCKYYPNKGLNLPRTDNWLSNRLILVKNIPSLQNQFNILIPVTPDAINRSPPKYLTLVFFAETHTIFDVTGLLIPLSVYRVYGPTVTGTLTGTIPTINNLQRESGGSSATPDIQMSTDTFAKSGTFTVGLNTTNMYSNSVNNTFTYGNSDSSNTFGTKYGAGYTITSFYYNIFSSSTVSWNKVPSNTAATCSIFGYVYNQKENIANNLFKTGKWIYTAFCPIDSTHNLQSSDANINLVNPQYPSVFTNNFDLRSIITIAYSNQDGYLRAYRKESNTISTLVRSCTTAKLQTYNPSSFGKQRAPFTISLPAIAMSQNGYEGYHTFQVEFAIPSSTAASSGLAMLSECDVTATNLACTIVGSPSSASITIQLQYTGTGQTTVSFLQVNLYATVPSVFGTAAPYTVTVYLPQYFTAGGFTIPFGNSYASSKTTYCTCSSSFTVGITAYGTTMSLNSYATSTKMTKTRTKLSFNFGALSYRDAFFKTSTFNFNLGYLTNPNFATYKARNNFRCIIYEGLTQTSMSQSSSWERISLTAFSDVILYPKNQITTPSAILYSMQCFGGAMPDGTNTSAITAFWKDNLINVQTASSLTYNSALYSNGFPNTATITIQNKRFRTVGFKSLYSFGVSCNTLLNANAIFYFDFHMALNPYLDNEGGVECYIRTSSTIDDSAAQSTYCSFSNQWQLMVWNNQNSISSGTIFYIDIYNIDQPKVADITSFQYISVTIDGDNNYDNGVLAMAQVNDNSPVSNAVTDIYILSTTIDNTHILMTQMITINIDTITTNVFSTVNTFYVIFPASYSEWLTRGQIISNNYILDMTDMYCIFLATGQSVNQATNCVFISKRILKITINSIAATRLFTLTLGNIQTPSAVPSGKFNEFKFKLFASDGTQSNIQYYSFTDYSKSITLTSNQNLISLSWGSYSISIADSFFTLSSTNSQVITIKTGYYSNIIELKQSIYPENFQANLKLALSNSLLVTYFSYFGNQLNVNLGYTTNYFKIGATYLASPGLYTLKFTKTGDTNNVYTNIPPLTLVIQSTKCQLNTAALNYQLPLGGSTLPVIINAISCIPLDHIIIGVTFTGTGSTSFSLNNDLSSIRLSNTSLDGQIYLVFTHRIGSLVAGNSITVSFTITGTNAASYLTIPSITLTLVATTSFLNSPTATALSAPILSDNTASFKLQCNQHSMIYWGLGLHPSIINNQAVDLQARIISQGNGLMTNFTQSYDYFDRTYGVLQGSTMGVITKKLYNLQSNTNYLFKYFCVNQLGKISDSQSINFTSVNYGAYLMKIEMKFQNKITYQQYNNLACSIAKMFNLPYVRVLTQAMSYCQNMPFVFYATSTAFIFNQPDPSGRYIYTFYIQPDYTIISDTTNINIKNQLSTSSSSANIISSTDNSASLPALVQIQTYDISIYTTPIISINTPVAGLTSTVITATITNMNGFIVIGVYSGFFNSSVMTTPSVSNIKLGKFSASVNLLQVKMRHTTQNYQTSFQFSGLNANSIYSFFYFCTVEDPKISALSSSVGVTSVQTLKMLVIDINWQMRNTIVIIFIVLILIFM